MTDRKKPDPPSVIPRDAIPRRVGQSSVRLEPVPSAPVVAKDPVAEIPSLDEIFADSGADAAPIGATAKVLEGGPATEKKPDSAPPAADAPLLLTEEHAAIASAEAAPAVDEGKPSSADPAVTAGKPAESGADPAKTDESTPPTAETKPAAPPEPASKVAAKLDDAAAGPLEGGGTGAKTTSEDGVSAESMNRILARRRPPAAGGEASEPAAKSKEGAAPALDVEAIERRSRILTAARPAPEVSERPRSMMPRVLAGALVVAIAAGGAWWYFKPKKVKTPRQSAQAEQTVGEPGKAGSAPSTTKPEATASSAPPAAAAAPAAPAAPVAPPPAPAAPAATTTEPPAPVTPPPPKIPRAELPAVPIEALRRMAEAGDLDAIEELAFRYIRGTGVPADPVEGGRWLRRAADSGVVSAIFNVGVMLERGVGVPADPVAAREWYARAGAAGEPRGWNNLGMMLRDGIGGPADPRRAHDTLMLAGRLGLTRAMFMLGEMYERGNPAIGKDPTTAVVWYAMTGHFDRARPEPENAAIVVAADAKVLELQRTLPAADLQRAQRIGEAEYRIIVDTMRNAARARSAGAIGFGPPATASGPSASGASTPGAGASGGFGPPPTGSAARPPASAAAAPTTPTPAAPSTTAPPAAAPAAKPAAPADPRVRLVEIQRMLTTLSFYTGEADGVIGPATRAAIREFEKLAGMPETGEPTAGLHDALREQVELTGRPR